jgi:hypothetical protein
MAFKEAARSVESIKSVHCRYRLLEAGAELRPDMIEHCGREDIALFLMDAGIRIFAWSRDRTVNRIPLYLTALL